MSLVYSGLESNIKINRRELSYIKDCRDEHIIPEYNKGYGGDWITFQIIIRRMKRVNQYPSEKFVE